MVLLRTHFFLSPSYLCSISPSSQLSEAVAHLSETSQKRGLAAFRTSANIRKLRWQKNIVMKLTHGPSVSICKLSSGICLTTSMFSSVYILQPLTPTSRPNSTTRFISSTVPVKLCTRPFFGRFGSLATSSRSKSSLAARECKKSGS